MLYSSNSSSGGAFTGMAKTTICFGVVLILLGIFGFVATGSHAPTALIPALFGLLLAIFGFLAITDDAKRRMLFMHIAVTLGLLGFLGTAKSIYDYIQMLGGRQFPHPVAVEEKAAMSILMLVFVGLCVRSFIAARRARA
jgi:multisubunit Na+/H+ antiporter MnhF subunit